MALIAEDRTHFENEDWAVMESGLEHKRTGYFIARDEIASRRSDGLWSWPLHMAEKTWCDMPAFTEAFSCAAHLYGVPADADLAQSFKMARCEIAVPAAIRTQKIMQKTMPGFDPERSRVLQENERAPISWKPAGAGQSASHSNRLGSLPQDRLRTRESGHGYALSSMARARSGRTEMGRNAPWRASRHIKKAGTQIVRLLWAAWSIR
jgi:hypothetical protein